MTIAGAWRVSEMGALFTLREGETKVFKVKDESDAKAGRRRFESMMFEIASAVSGRWWAEDGASVNGTRL